MLDHIDGDRKNNAIANLRVVTPLENSRNRRSQSANSSGRLGVSFCKTRRKWLADVSHKNRVIHLGAYKTKEDAIAARVAGEKYLYGLVADQLAEVA